MLVDIDTGTASVELLDHIVLPSHACVILDACVTHEHNTVSVWSAGAKKASGINIIGPLFPATRLDVRFLDLTQGFYRWKPQILSICVTSEVTLSPPFNPPPQFDVFLKVTPDHLDMLAYRHFNDFLTIYHEHLCHVTHVSIRAPRPDIVTDQASWRALSMLPAIQDLELHLSSPDFLTSSFHRSFKGLGLHEDETNSFGSESEEDVRDGLADAADAEDPLHRPVTFPRLAKLRLSGLLHSPASITGPGLLTQLVSIARARCKMGVPLECIELSGHLSACPDLEHDDAKALKDYVKHLSWEVIGGGARMAV